MDISELRETFFAECADQLSELETGLYSVSADAPDVEVVNSVFRAVHSIKGGAGAFGLDDLVAFAHVFENALDVIRSDIAELSDERVTILLRASDVLNDIVVASQVDGDPVDFAEMASSLEREFNLATGEDEEVEVEFDAVPIQLDDFDFDGEDASEGGAKNRYEIHFAPTRELFLNGNDPLRIFRELGQLGELAVKANISELTAIDEWTSEEPCLSYNLTLETEVEIDQVRGPFEWVDNLCTLEIEQTESAAPQLDVDISDFLSDEDSEELSALAELDEGLEDESLLESEGPGLGSDLAPDEVSAEIELSSAVEEIQDTDPPNKTEEAVAPEPVLELAAQEPKKVASAASSSDGSAKNAAKVASTIRVDSEKVDRLINLMGEMVISQSMLSMQIDESEIGNSSPTALALVELQNLTRDIQSSVMAIRAQPIKPVFMRMSRVVREVCASTGKRANLILEGENTEVDTTVIEGLIDPLTHMIRNSVDHGIEESDIRLERGKSEVGNITLSASHSSGSIIIEIKDDGAGINREKLKDSAIQKGIISADAKLSDDEIDNLIFAPGFSTSEKVTDVSGRGVGMDVVRQSIQSLGGRVNIASVPEKGSHFTLHLPLTLAILEGMLVQCCEQVLVLPVTSVLETMVLKPQDIHAIGKNQRVFKLRKDLVPIVDVGFELGFVPKRSEFTQGTVVVVESGKNNMCAFVVDSIVGQQQVVIKSMESNYRRIPSIAAATILGSGRIALILDVDEIVNRNSLEGAGPAALDLIA